LSAAEAEDPNLAAAASSQPPTVSVIVPFLTHADRLHACVRALCAQTYPKDRYTIVLVNNGRELREERFSDAAANVYVIREDKPGSYAARNCGLESSSGEVLAFTDADCIPAPDWIEQGVASLMASPNRGLVGGRIEVVFADPRRPSAVEIFESLSSFRQQDYVERWQFAATANLFAHRHVFDAVGRFDDRLLSLADREWGARVSRAGFSLAYAHAASVQHPARRSLAELARRSARTTGGFVELVRVRRSARDVWQDVRFGLTPGWLLARGASAPLGRRARLRALAVMGFVMAVRGIELCRLSSGARPKRL
jgi:cellulose synthase/poly-beta-1,6-N-acetylglucosamine synthase-like glycosyltransferase